MSAEEVSLAGFFRRVASTLEAAEQRPYGPEADETQRKVAGEFLLRVTGDRDKAVAAWTAMIAEFGGYMPTAATHALCRAKFAPDIVVPDAAPEVD